MAVKVAAVEGGLVLAILWTCLASFGGARLGLAGLPAALAACWVVSGYYANAYSLRAASSGRFPWRLAGSLALAGGLGAVCYALVPHARPAAPSLLPGLILAPAVVLPFRVASMAFVRRRALAERILILGVSPMAERLLAEIAAQHPGRYTVLGVVDDAVAPGTERLLHCRRLGTPDDLGVLLARTRPDRIVVTLTSRRGRLPLPSLLEARARGIAVEDGAEFYERLTGKLAIEALTPSSLIFCKDFSKSRLQLAAGGLLSVAAAALGLLVSAPLLGLIALAIVLDSRGPVLFLHERVGAGGRRFLLLKFRTMRPVARARSEWVKDNGYRITRVGSWLRKFRLDELPQFINVLKGDMNLVGPRPHPVSNFELFTQKIPYYSLRSSVRPGITGWAQVRYGYANNLDQETEKMRYDLYYIKHMSFGLDLRILFETVRTVLLGRGSSEPRSYERRRSAIA